MVLNNGNKGKSITNIKSEDTPSSALTLKLKKKKIQKVELIDLACKRHIYSIGISISVRIK